LTSLLNGFAKGKESDFFKAQSKGLFMHAILMRFNRPIQNIHLLPHGYIGPALIVLLN